jgi:hypothetical protein
MGMKHLSNFLRFGAVLLTSLTMLSGCGGGGGGSSPPPSGVLSVTVSDTYGVVAGATVLATIGTTSLTGTTDAQGVALLLFREAVGAANVTVSRPTFVSQNVVSAPITANQVTPLTVTLVRATSAAGGSLTSRGASPTVSVSDDKKSMTFEIELVIVDGNSDAIENLNAANFVLSLCTPDPANSKVDCVRGADANFDAVYTPVSATPQAWELIPGAPAEPYAAALMLDQSGSIFSSDPTGARLYSAKAFLDQLGVDDWGLLSAFADGDAKILNKPLTVYPSFRNSATVSDPLSYFSTLDSLAALVGGNTPLYDALDSLRLQVVSDSSLPSGIAKSVVIFTDGDDTYCSDPNACRTRRQASITAANTAGVRIFTIGLSSNVNFEALGELANQTGGAFLYADSAEQLIPLYGSVGKLLSLSLPTYRLTWTVQAGSSAFQSGNALLGRVEVTAGGSTFDVPFIVGIP